MSLYFDLCKCQKWVLQELTMNKNGMNKKKKKRIKVKCISDDITR